MDNTNHQEIIATDATAGPKESKTSGRASGIHRGPTRMELAQSPTPLVNVTTRLTFAVNDLLTEAALRQRLKRKSPATRQAILEEALHDWLQLHGYGR